MGAVSESRGHDIDRNHARWNWVINEIAIARGIADNDAEGHKKIRRQVSRLRNDIGIVIVEDWIGPKAKFIADFHYFIASAPPEPIIRRERFTGIRLSTIAGFTRRRMKSGKPLSAVMHELLADLRPFFDRGKPRRAASIDARLQRPKADVSYVFH
jgi:hypothetical protein